jgi:hypothetical protein
LRRTNGYGLTALSDGNFARLHETTRQRTIVEKKLLATP